MNQEELLLKTKSIFDDYPTMILKAKGEVKKEGKFFDLFFVGSIIISFFLHLTPPIFAQNCFMLIIMIWLCCALDFNKIAKHNKIISEIAKKALAIKEEAGVNEKFNLMLNLYDEVGKINHALRNGRALTAEELRIFNSALDETNLITNEEKIKIVTKNRLKIKEKTADKNEQECKIDQEIALLTLNDVIALITEKKMMENTKKMLNS